MTQFGPKRRKKTLARGCCNKVAITLLEKILETSPLSFALDGMWMQSLELLHPFLPPQGTPTLGRC